MNQLTPCIVSEGICEIHRRFRRTSQEFELTAYCPSCKRGEPVQMRQIGAGLTRKKLPHSEATDRIFSRFGNTVQMPNTKTNLPEGL